MAVAAESRRRHESAGGNEAPALHKAMVEQAIRGYDVQLSAVLGLPNLSALRLLPATEPVVSNQRLQRAHRTASSLNCPPFPLLLH